MINPVYLSEDERNFLRSLANAESTAALQAEYRATDPVTRQEAVKRRERANGALAALAGWGRPLDDLPPDRRPRGRTK